MKNNKNGFTLIELLVVVLIIGILAAVALPQYKKAVLKSRLAQWDVSFDAGRKAIEMYLLENGGFPSSTVYLTGKNSVSSVEIPGNCTINNIDCFTSAGSVSIYCSSGSCQMTLSGNLNADGTYGNKLLDGAQIRYQYTSAEDASFIGVTKEPACRWVAASYPNIPVKKNQISNCSSKYNVTLPNPEK